MPVALCASLICAVPCQSDGSDPTEEKIYHLYSIQMWLDAAAESSLELDASGGVVRWKDRSGHGFDAVQEDPELRPHIETSPNGGRQLAFSGDLMQLDGGAGEMFAYALGTTVFAVVGASPNATNSGDQTRGYVLWGSTRYYPDDPERQRWGLHHSDNEWTMEARHEDRDVLETARGPAESGTGILTAWLNYERPVAKLLWNGESFAKQPLIMVGPSETFASVLVCLGARPDGQYAFEGALSEILVFSRALEVTELNLIGAYLAKKHQLRFEEIW